MLADYGAHLADDAVLVAVDSGGTVRGYAVMLDRPDGFWLENIAVDPAAQEQGIGSSLIDAVEDWFRGRTDHYRLYTNLKMTANIAWYSRAGFVETGRAMTNGFHRVYFEKQISPIPDDK